MVRLLTFLSVRKRTWNDTPQNRQPICINRSWRWSSTQRKTEQKNNSIHQQTSRLQNPPRRQRSTIDPWKYWILCASRQQQPQEDRLRVYSFVHRWQLVQPRCQRSNRHPEDQTYSEPRWRTSPLISHVWQAYQVMRDNADSPPRDGKRHSVADRGRHPTRCRKASLR